MRLAGHVAIMGDRIGACWVLVVRPEGKTSLGRPGLRWEDNIKMDFKEVGWRGMDWIDLDQDRDRWQAVVNLAMKFSCSIKCWEFLN